MRRTVTLGKLKEVEIRRVWGHERSDFSAWLAEEENVREIGDILGLNLIDVETEKSVGAYYCDILCKDELTGKVVVIENQLEATNHDHLGKIITYASGLDASVIVWIVKSAREEHASAIEWLNKHTDEEISFFLLEVHAYQIGNSDPAPMFKIIEQPNNFSRNIRAIARDNSMNERKANRLEFWTVFNETLENERCPFNKRKATTDHWYDVAMGSSKCLVRIELVNKEGLIRVSVIIFEDKEIYDKFYAAKNEIESQIGQELVWRDDMKKSFSASISIEGLNFNDKKNYRSLMKKTIETVVLLRDVFKKYL